jgi:ParB family transcriptional regulator, chromosome partitioning protein
MSELAHIPLTDLVTGGNPRRRFSPKEMAELEQGVKAAGVILQPITVRRCGDGLFQIVAGERRFRAARSVLGEDYKMPAHILQLDDQAAAAAAVIENTHRADMSPVEEAEAAARLLAELAGDKPETARRLGWSPVMLEHRLALMNATEAVREALLDEKILLGHAELIAAAEKSKQDKILTGVLAAPTRPTVAQLKEMLAQIARPLDKACFDVAQCHACAQNSTRQAGMFAESIGAGSCTGPECFAKKTDEALNAKRTSLVETWARVEIVRPGDNYTVMKLKVEGDGGVGEEQGKVCHQCKNFGAAISAAPDKMGRVFEDMCFDSPCNTRMVARQLRAQAEEAAKGQPAAAGKGESKSSASKPKAKRAVAATLSSAVVEFRKKLWRQAFETEVVVTPDRALITLLALAATHNGGRISQSKTRSVVEARLSTNGSVTVEGLDMGEIARKLVGTPKDNLAAAVLQLAGTAAEDLEIREVEGMLNAFGVDLARYFEVDEVYLKLLTKTEIQAVAEEIGLGKAYGEKFNALFGQKKDDLIKALLSVKGFNFAVVPAALRCGAPEKA